MFTFPAAICLFAAGVHVVTDPLPRRQLYRWAAAILVTAIALVRPLHVEYYEVNDVPLIDYLAAHAETDDELIVSPSGIFLVAYYGPWPVTPVETDRFEYAITTIARERTRYLYPPRTSEADDASRYLAESQPDRAWYLAYRTSVTEPDVIAAIEARGYQVRQVQETRRGRLYLALATR